MSATIIHHGHVRLIARAASYGEVILGLTADHEIEKVKGYTPELSFEYRREILLSLKHVAQVVEVPWQIDVSVLDRFGIDLLIHGEDNSNLIPKERLLIFPRTEGVSSTEIRHRALRSIYEIRNRKKKMYTPGPSCILPENILGLRPVFGRGDDEYISIEREVMKYIKRLAGQDHLVRIQGSATLAIEMAIRNFVRGKVLVVLIGYYSERLQQILEGLLSILEVSIDTVHYDELASVSGTYDWVFSVYTETSHAFKADVQFLREFADHLKARLFLDATGSIGLEKDHHLADLMAFSSCKGLFGLVGAGFVSYRQALEKHNVEGFYLDIDLHARGGVTGPYHAISSLYEVLPKLEIFSARVHTEKQKFLSKYRANLTVPAQNQPLLCTHINTQFLPTPEEGVTQVLYTPRSGQPGTIVCHLGGAYRNTVN